MPRPNNNHLLAIILAALTILAIVVPPPPAHAGGTPPPPNRPPCMERGDDGGAYHNWRTCHVNGFRTSEGVGDGNGAEAPPDAPTPPKDDGDDWVEAWQWVDWWQYGANAGGQPCYYREAGYFDVNLRSEASILAERQIERGRVYGVDLIMIDLDNGWLAGPCASYDDFFRDEPLYHQFDDQELWDIAIAHLPTAQPAIPPGRALPGLEMTLETRRPLTIHQTGIHTSVGLILDITGQATFTVDWGDGTIDGPFDHPGAARDPANLDDPDAIHHTWIYDGLHNVTITDTWELTFTDQYGRTSTTSGQTTPATLPIDVTELQGVIVD